MTECSFFFKPFWLAHDQRWFNLKVMFEEEFGFISQEHETG